IRHGYLIEPTTNQESFPCRFCGTTKNENIPLLGGCRGELSSTGRPTLKARPSAPPQRGFSEENCHVEENKDSCLCISTVGRAIKRRADQTSSRQPTLLSVQGSADYPDHVGRALWCGD